MSKFLIQGTISAKHGAPQQVYAISDVAFMDYNVQKYFNGIVLDTDSNLVTRFYSIGSANFPHPQVEVDEDRNFYGYGHGNWGTQNKFAPDGTLIDGAFQGGYILMAVGDRVFVHLPFGSGNSVTHALSTDGTYIGTTSLTYNSNYAVRSWCSYNENIYSVSYAVTTAHISCYDIFGTYQWNHIIPGTANNCVVVADKYGNPCITFFNGSNQVFRKLSVTNRSTVFSLNLNTAETILTTSGDYFYTRTSSTVYKRRLSDGGIEWQITKAIRNLQCDSAGNVYMVGNGTTTSYTTRKNIWKYSSSGSLIWERDLGAYIYGGMNGYYNLNGIRVY